MSSPLQEKGYTLKKEDFKHAYWACPRQIGLDLCGKRFSGASSLQCFAFFKGVQDFFGDKGLSVSTSRTTPRELKQSVHPRRKQNFKKASKSPFVHT